MDGTATTDYSYDKSSGVITFNTAPGNAKAIVVNAFIRKKHGRNYLQKNSL